MVSETRANVIVDADFVESVSDVKDITLAYVRAAMEAGDDNKETYLRGMLRGVEICMENYQICLDAMAKDQREQALKDLQTNLNLTTMDSST
jgi:hypothetical protein